MEFVTDWPKLFSMKQVVNQNAFILLFLLFGYISPVEAAFETVPAGARSLALSNSLVGEYGSSFAIYLNPAAISGNNSLHFSYRNFYGLPGISLISMCSNSNLFSLPVAAAVSRFGNELYAEYRLRVAVARKVTDEFYIGIETEFYQLQIDHYGSASAVGIHLGILYRISPQLSAGAMVSNLNRPAIGRSEEDLPQSFSLGIHYAITDNLSITSSLFRDIRFTETFRAGVSYKLYPFLEARFGIDDTPGRYSFGIGSVWNRFIFDYALQVHSVLGVSHEVQFGIEI